MTSPNFRFSQDHCVDAFENLTRWGEKGHEDLEVKEVSEGGRTYSVIQTKPHDTTEKESDRKDVVAMVREVIEQNKDLFSALEDDLLMEVTTNLKKRCKGDSYFNDLFKKAITIVRERSNEDLKEAEIAARSVYVPRDIANMRIEATESLKDAGRIRDEAVAFKRELQALEEAKKTGQIALVTPSQLDKVQKQYAKREKGDLAFTCNDGRPIYAHSSVLAENELIEAAFDTAKEFKGEKNDKVRTLDILKNFSREAIEYFVAFQYGMTGETKLELPLLIEVEALARFIDDKSLLEASGQAIKSWQGNKAYPLLFSDLLEKHVFPADSGIYRKIPKEQIPKMEERLSSLAKEMEEIRKKEPLSADLKKKINQLEESAYTLAANLDVIEEIQKSTPAIPEGACGSAFWEKNGVTIFGAEPPIPQGLLDRYNEGGCTLLLKPGKVRLSGKDKDELFSVDLIKEYLQSDRLGDKRIYLQSSYFNEVVMAEVAKEVISNEPEWVLLSDTLIEGSRNKTFEQQMELIKTAGFEKVPTLREALLFGLSNHITGKAQPFGDSSSYTRCEENGTSIWGAWRACVSFSGSRLNVDRDFDSDIDNIGAVGFRKF